MYLFILIVLVENPVVEYGDLLLSQNQSNSVDSNFEEISPDSRTSISAHNTADPTPEYYRWKDVLAMKYVEFVCPENNTPLYNKIRKATYNFLQRNCTSPELDLHKDSKKLKIPGRLVDTYITWFRDAEKHFFDDPDGNTPWTDVIKTNCPTLAIPGKESGAYKVCLNAVCAFLTSHCNEQEIQLIQTSFRTRIPSRLEKQFVEWFKIAHATGFENFTDGSDHENKDPTLNSSVLAKRNLPEATTLGLKKPRFSE